VGEPGPGPGECLLGPGEVAPRAQQASADVAEPSSRGAVVAPVCHLLQRGEERVGIGQAVGEHERVGVHVVPGPEAWLV
jgi:hypothetical protein